MQPQPSNIAATLGPRPGNILRPPPNNFNLYSWTPKGGQNGRRGPSILETFANPTSNNHLDERATIPNLSLQDFEKNVEFFSLEAANANEPEIIAGININEIVTKKQPESEKNDVVMAPVSPVKPASPSKPVAPQSKVSSPSKASPTVGSPARPASPQK